MDSNKKLQYLNWSSKNFLRNGLSDLIVTMQNLSILRKSYKQTIILLLLGIILRITDQSRVFLPTKNKTINVQNLFYFAVSRVTYHNAEVEIRTPTTLKVLLLSINKFKELF